MDNGVKVVRLMVAFSLVTASSLLFAGGGGTRGGALEITQLANKVKLAASYAQQLIDYGVQMRQLASFDDEQFIDGLVRADNEFAAAAELVNQGRALYGSLQELNDLATSRYNQFAASGLTWEDYVNRQVHYQNHQMGVRQIMTNHEVEVMQRVQRNYGELQAVAARIPATEGTHQSLQLLNSQMAILSGTMNEMLSFNASVSRKNTERELVEDANKEAEELRAVHETTVMQAGAMADKALLEKLDKK